MSTPDPALTEWVPLAVGGGGPIGPVGPAGPAGPQGPPGTGGIPALAGIVSDFNQALVSGLYFTTYNPANRPSWEGAIVNGAFALLVIKAAPGSGQGGDDDVYQITWRTEDQRMWMRSWQYGYWMDWTPLQMPNRLRENMERIPMSWQERSGIQWLLLIQRNTIWISGNPKKTTALLP